MGNNAPASAPENIVPVVETVEATQAEYEGTRVEAVADSIGEERGLGESVEASQPTNPADRPFANPADAATTQSETTVNVVDQVGKTYEQALADNDQAAIDAMDVLLQTMPADTVATDAARYETYVKQGGLQKAPEYFAQLEAVEAEKAAQLVQAAEREAAENGGKVSMETQMSLMEARIKPLFKIFEAFLNKIKGLFSRIKGETTEEPAPTGVAAAEKLQDDFEAGREQIVANEAQEAAEAKESAFNTKLAMMARVTPGENDADKANFRNLWEGVKIKGHTVGTSENQKLLEANFTYPEGEAALDEFAELLKAAPGSKAEQLLGFGFSMETIQMLGSKLDSVDFGTRDNAVSLTNEGKTLKFNVDQEDDLVAFVEGGYSIEIQQSVFLANPANAPLKGLFAGDYSNQEKEFMMKVLDDARARSEDMIKVEPLMLTLNPKHAWTNVESTNTYRLTDNMPRSVHMLKQLEAIEEDLNNLS